MTAAAEITYETVWAGERVARQKCPALAFGWAVATDVASTRLVEPAPHFSPLSQPGGPGDRLIRTGSDISAGRAGIVNLSQAFSRSIDCRRPDSPSYWFIIFLWQVRRSPVAKWDCPSQGPDMRWIQQWQGWQWLTPDCRLAGPSHALSSHWCPCRWLSAGETTTKDRSPTPHNAGPANDAGLTLGQRRRRWPSVEPASFSSIQFIAASCGHLLHTLVHIVPRSYPRPRVKPLRN